MTIHVHPLRLWFMLHVVLVYYGTTGSRAVSIACDYCTRLTITIAIMALAPCACRFGACARAIMHNDYIHGPNDGAETRERGVALGARAARLGESG